MWESFLEGTEYESTHEIPHQGKALQLQKCDTIDFILKPYLKVHMRTYNGEKP